MHYNVLPASDLRPVYEPLFQLLRTTSGKTRSSLCELLARVTSTDEARAFRVKLLKELVHEGRGADLQGPAVLLKKFKFLRPDLVPEVRTKPKVDLCSDLCSLFQNLTKYPVPNASNSRIALAFQTNYPEQNPFEEDFDRLIPQGKLSWTQEILVRRERKRSEEVTPVSRFPIWILVCFLIFFFLFQSRPKRQKIQFPTAEESPLDRSARDESTPDGATPGTMTLAKCSRVEELFANLERISTPAQTISLMRQRSTFMFLTLNRNPKQVQTRFSLTLYHTLFNEFFGSNASSKKNDSKVTRWRTE